MSYFDPEQGRALYAPDVAARIGATDVLDRLRATPEATAATDPAAAAADAHTQLCVPAGLLVKMNIASMACSLERRSPWLDQDVVEFGHGCRGR